MDSRKVLSGLSYFSIFFAAILFPLVVFLASDDEETKRHAKKALLLHLIPLIPVPVLLYSIFSDLEAINHNVVPLFTIIMIIVTVLVSMIVAILNVIKGVKAFM